MHKITNVTTKPHYTLAITFEDGTSGEVCLKDRLFGPMFEPLKDPNYFAKVKIDRFGALCWPNEADLAPDALYQQIKSH
ncbi:MAG: DUF2442 domain-containing protein [Cellvibrionaceae bacterium]|nr:DUF2442 domain-containing protein [Cellvibrionaceae bacterium]